MNAKREKEIEEMKKGSFKSLEVTSINKRIFIKRNKENALLKQFGRTERKTN